jgi:hypothetical protein
VSAALKRVKRRSAVLLVALPASLACASIADITLEDETPFKSRASRRAHGHDFRHMFMLGMTAVFVVGPTCRCIHRVSNCSWEGCILRHSRVDQEG